LRQGQRRGFFYIRAMHLIPLAPTACIAAYGRLSTHGSRIP
jgi:hypothetical protein